MPLFRPVRIFSLKIAESHGGKGVSGNCQTFLSIFYPAAVYQKINLTAQTPTGVNKEGQKYLENFNAGFKVLVEPGYLKVAQSYKKQKEEAENSDENINVDINIIERLKKLKKNDKLCVADWSIKEGETTPPKRYNSGSLILAMENAGQLIEDEELRAQIKGSGIGTSATRAEIIKNWCASVTCT